MKKVKLSHVSNSESLKRTLKRISLVATYHPLLNPLGKVLSKNLNILYMDEEVKKVFYPGPWFHFEVPGKLVATL